MVTGKFDLLEGTISVADPDHIDTDPDPTFYFYSDPDPTIDTGPDPDPYCFKDVIYLCKTVLFVHLKGSVS